MTANDKLHVEVLDDEIIITLPGTSYAVTYYRATAFPQRLLTKSHSGGEDHDAPMLPDCHERARGLRLRPADFFYFGVFASRKSRTVASSCSFVTSNTFSMYCFACDTELVDMET